MKQPEQSPASSAGRTSTTYSLDTAGSWSATGTPPTEGDEAVLAKARRELAQDQPDAAHATIDKWIKSNEQTSNALLPQAYLLRADATAAGGNEYEALFDYEMLIKSFPSSPEYVTAVSRELDIASTYLNGTRRKMLGIRWVNAEKVGEELLLRVHERLPGSRLAERAGIELADYYYRTSDLESAAIAYELFQQNHPRSAYAMRARQRQIFSNLGQFKGPRYDSTKLLDSKALIDRFQNDYPAQAELLGLDATLLSRIDESNAEQMLETANWYIRREELESARLVLNRLVRKYPQTGAGQRALAQLQERNWLVQTGAEKAAATGTPTPVPAPPTQPPGNSPKGEN